MNDSLVLAEAIFEHAGKADQIPNAIKKYEEEMFVRAEEFARTTEKAMICHFSGRGVDQFLARLDGEHAW